MSFSNPIFRCATMGASLCGHLEADESEVENVSGPTFICSPEMPFGPTPLRGQAVATPSATPVRVGYQYLDPSGYWWSPDSGMVAWEPFQWLPWKALSEERSEPGPSGIAKRVQVGAGHNAAQHQTPSQPPEALGAIRSDCLWL